MNARDVGGRQSLNPVPVGFELEIPALTGYSSGELALDSLMSQSKSVLTVVVSSNYISQTSTKSDERSFVAMSCVL